MTTLKFANGIAVPALGFGTWLAAKGLVGASVKKALECGYKHIDCAHVYGNEEEVGEAFKSVWDAGQVKREDVFVTSKLWVKDMAKDDVLDACRLTLKNLQLEYLDLYLIHLPNQLSKELATGIPFTDEDRAKHVIGYTDEGYWQCWQAMEELVEKGLVKSIGVSNMTIKKIEALLAHNPKIVPASNQVELHPYLPQRRLKEYCESKGIIMTAFSPLGNPGRPDGEKRESDAVLMEDDVIKGIAQKHKATVGQVLLQWNIQDGNLVLAKSTQEHRILENLASQNVKLDNDDVTAINSITTRARYLTQKWGLKTGQPVEELWDGEFFN